MKISQEKENDKWEVEALFDLCFAPGREALSSYRLREKAEKVTELCSVVRDQSGLLAAAIRFWPVKIYTNKALLLGPIAVHPTFQGEGLGAMLICESLDMAASNSSHWQRVLLVGDQSYFGRFGFFPLKRVFMPPPTNPMRILGRNLIENAWNGVEGVVKPEVEMPG